MRAGSEFYGGSDRNVCLYGNLICLGGLIAFFLVVKREEVGYTILFFFFVWVKLKVI